MTRRILNVSKKENTGQIDIYGEIVPESWRWADEESAYHFKDALEKIGDVDTITLNINSPGGDVFEGIAIYNMLKRHKAKIVVNIDGLAASIASVIAMAGDVVKMPSNSMMMVHNAMSGGFGNANDLREIADLLEKVTSTLMNTYLDKTEKIKEATLKALLDAETWLTAEEAFSYGFVDEVITSKKIAACASKGELSMFNKVPESVLKMVETPEEDGSEEVETEESSDVERIESLEAKVTKLEADIEKLFELLEADKEDDAPEEDEQQINNKYYL